MRGESQVDRSQFQFMQHESYVHVLHHSSIRGGLSVRASQLVFVYMFPTFDQYEMNQIYVLHTHDS